MADVKRVAVPARARELADLDRVDYADCFTVAIAGDQSPVELLWRLIDTMPLLIRAVRVAHSALGLRLAPADSPDTPLGWVVLRDDAHEAVLGTTGTLGTPRIVGMTDPGRFTLATLLRFDTAVGRTMWAFAAPVHRTAARIGVSKLPSFAGMAST